MEAEVDVQLDGVGGQRHATTVPTPGKRRYIV